MDGQEPILSPEETGALLDALKDQNGASPLEAKQVELGSPESLLQDALAVAERRRRSLNQNLRTMLLANLGVATVVENETFEISPFKKLKDNFVDGGAIAILQSQDLDAGFLFLDPTMTSVGLSRQLGGSVRQDGPVSLHIRSEELSPVERRLIVPFVQSLLDALSLGEINIPLGVRTVLSSMTDLANYGEFTSLLSLPFKLNINETAEGTVTYALSKEAAASLAQDSTPRLGPGKASRRSERNDLLARLKSAQVEVVAVLGTAHSTVRHVLSLDEGDILRLQSIPSHPIEVKIAGKHVLQGTPGVHHGNLAVTVTEIW